jgi:hypothetical protein
VLILCITNIHQGQETKLDQFSPLFNIKFKKITLKLSIYFFIKISSGKVLEKHQENIKKAWKNGLEFLTKFLKHEGVQIARDSDKNSKKTRKHAVRLGPNPSPREEQILDPSGITEGRWIDPTGSTLRSNGQDAKPVVQD